MEASAAQGQPSRAAPSPPQPRARDPKVPMTPGPLTAQISAGRATTASAASRPASTSDHRKQIEAASPAALAEMLSCSYRQIDVLKAELAAAHKTQGNTAAVDHPSTPGADHATMPSNSELRPVTDADNRAKKAEYLRDDAHARLVSISQAWQEVERHMLSAERSFSDARLAFNRVMMERGTQMMMLPVALPHQVRVGRAINSPMTSQQTPHSSHGGGPSVPPFAYPAPLTSHATHAPFMSHAPTHGAVPASAVDFTSSPNPTVVSAGLDARLDPAASSRNYSTSLRRPRAEFSESDDVATTDTPPPKRFRSNVQDTPHDSAGRARFQSIEEPHPSDDERRARRQRIEQGKARRSQLDRSAPPRPLFTRTRTDVTVEPASAQTRQDPTPGIPPARITDTAAGPIHARQSASSSRSTSPSVDEMLFAAATEKRHPDNRTGMNSPTVPSLNPQSTSSVENFAANPSSLPSQHFPPPTPTTDPRVFPAYGQMQAYQTHIFAPPMTGAPVKKQRRSQSASSLQSLTGQSASLRGSSDSPLLSSLGPGGFPAVNSDGQRLCRQCGVPGRYKDGKCVEKWGPGPDGPGTVCDRCRKKIKRVERRETAEFGRPTPSPSPKQGVSRHYQSAAGESSTLRFRPYDIPSSSSRSMASTFEDGERHRRGPDALEYKAPSPTNSQDRAEGEEVLPSLTGTVQRDRHVSVKDEEEGYGSKESGLPADDEQLDRGDEDAEGPDSA